MTKTELQTLIDNLYRLPLVTRDGETPEQTADRVRKQLLEYISKYIERH